MGRKSAKELIKIILESIADNPKSIHEIAQDCNSNWESVKRYLESLKEAGVIQETSDGNKRLFSILSCNIPTKEGNYFGLPIEEEDKKKINSLFYKIKEEWKKSAGRLPGKVQVQKTIVRVNKICNLKLPVGWYLFGAMCVKPYDPTEQYNYTGLSQTTITCVKEVVNDYSKESSACTLKLRQYKEENKILYQTKELILTLFSSSKFSKKYIKEINTQLYILIKNLPKIFDNDATELINEFVGIVLQLLNNLSEEDIQFAKNDIHQTFNEVWKLIALFSYFDDLEPYYIENFSREIELKHFILEMNLQKIEVIEHLSYLSDLIPQESEPEDEAYQKLKNIFTSIRELSPEEKKQKEKELDKIRKEKGEDTVQDFLLEKFGLN